MFDALSIIFWGITYLLIIVFSLKNKATKARAISLLPPILNMSWELNACIVSLGFWGHIIWLGLDIFVFICCAMSIQEQRKRRWYIFSLLPGALLFFPLFYVDYGMLMSSFVIDIVMAICFWVQRRKLLKEGRIIIAITKLLGDLSAVIYYASDSPIILVIGICVFVLNFAYLIYAINEAVRQKIGETN